MKENHNVMTDDSTKLFMTSTMQAGADPKPFFSGCTFLGHNTYQH